MTAKHEDVVEPVPPAPPGEGRGLGGYIVVWHDPVDRPFRADWTATLDFDEDPKGLLCMGKGPTIFPTRKDARDAIARTARDDAKARNCREGWYAVEPVFAALASAPSPAPASPGWAAMAVDALAGCVSAIDGLLGDSDLPDDDRPGVKAMQAAAEALTSAPAPSPTPASPWVAVTADPTSLPPDCGTVLVWLDPGEKGWRSGLSLGSYDSYCGWGLESWDGHARVTHWQRIVAPAAPAARDAAPTGGT